MQSYKYVLLIKNDKTVINMYKYSIVFQNKLF